MIPEPKKPPRKGSKAALKADSDRVALLAEVRKRFTQGVNADSTNRTNSIDNLKAVAGLQQWDDTIKKEREANGRPCLNFNQLPTFVSQVVGDQRQSRPSCKVRPVDNKATIEVAKFLSGLIRNIEADSHADVARDKSFDQAVKGSFGVRRIITEYENEESFNQVIKVKTIRNPLSVVWDPVCQEWDKTDAEWLIIYSDLAKDVFDAKYPDASPVNFETIDAAMSEWYSKEKVRVAEYFKKKDGDEKTIVQLKHVLIDQFGAVVKDETGNEVPGPRHGEVIDQKEFESQPAEPGLEIAKDKDGKEITRKVKSRKIVRYLVSGLDILEEEQEWPSKYWPVIPVEGRETDIEGKVYKRGLIDEAKDTQKAYNLSRNSEIEIFAMAPKTPVVATPKMLQGHQQQWADAHKKVYPFLYYNPDKDFPGQKPERMGPPQLSDAITHSTIQAREEMKGIIGIFNPGPWETSNEVSGVALRGRQKQSDVGSYEFTDNLIKSIELEYRIYLDLIPKIYDTERVVRILHLDGSVKNETINKPVVENGVQKVLNDLTVGRYDVTVTPGPSYSTQREEAVSNMLSLLQMAPQIAPFAAHLLVKNMDFSEAQDLSKYLKMGLFPKQFLKPEELEEIAKEYPNALKPLPLPPPVMAKAKKDEALAMKAGADAMKTAAEIEQLKVDTAQALMEIMDRVSAVLQGVNPTQQGLLNPPQTKPQGPNRSGMVKV